VAEQQGDSSSGYICAKVRKTKEAHEVLSTLEAVSANDTFHPYATALVQVGGNTIRPWTGWSGAYDAHDCIGSFLRGSKMGPSSSRCPFC